MNRTFPQGDQPRRPRDGEVTLPRRDPPTVDNLLREARRLLAARSFQEVIARLEVHRPAEWAAVDSAGARVLRLMAQAYVGLEDWRAARECLEHLRALQQERQRLTRDEFAAALSDLCRCYRSLGLDELARACQEEVRRLLLGP